MGGDGGDGGGHIALTWTRHSPEVDNISELQRPVAPLPPIPPSLMSARSEIILTWRPDRWKTLSQPF